MSSHHVVKEDQEPALLLLNPDAIAFEKIQELLEWSPLIIVSYSALEKVLPWGIKIDALLASTDDDTTQVAIDQAPLHIINSSGVKKTLELVGQFLLARKQVNLNIITNESATLFPVAASVSKSLTIILFDHKLRWHFVENASYSKWLPAQTILKTFVDNKTEEIIVGESGILKIERPTAFWIGEEY